MFGIRESFSKKKNRRRRKFSKLKKQYQTSGIEENFLFGKFGVKENFYSQKSCKYKKSSVRKKQYKKIGIREIFSSWGNNRNMVSEKVFQVGKIVSKIWCQEKIFQVGKAVSIMKPEGNHQQQLIIMLPTHCVRTTRKKEMAKNSVKNNKGRISHYILFIVRQNFDRVLKSYKKFR